MQRTTTAPYVAPRPLTTEEAYDMASRWLADSYGITRDDAESMAAWVAQLDRGSVEDVAREQRAAEVLAIKLERSERRIAEFEAKLRVVVSTRVPGSCFVTNCHRPATHQSHGWPCCDGHCDTRTATPITAAERVS